MASSGKRVSKGLHPPSTDISIDNDPTKTITTDEIRDLQSSLVFPVSQSDYSDARGLANAVYVLNRSGMDVKVLATTHGTDFKNEAFDDPLNYGLEVDQQLPNKCYFKISVRNSVKVEYKYSMPPFDQSPVYCPGMTVDSPNGKYMYFTKEAGNIVLKHRLNHRADPNCLKFENLTSNADISVTITRHIDIIGPKSEVLSTRPQYATKTIETHVKNGETFDYAHEVNLVLWATEFSKLLSPNEYGSRTNTVPVGSTQGPNRRDFRVGTSLICDSIAGIDPGSYVVIYQDANAVPKFAAYDISTVCIMPANDYVMPSST